MLRMNKLPSLVPVKLVLAFTRKREGGFLFLVLPETFTVFVSFRMDTRPCQWLQGQA